MAAPRQERLPRHRRVGLAAGGDGGGPATAVGAHGSARARARAIDRCANAVMAGHPRRRRGAHFRTVVVVVCRWPLPAGTVRCAGCARRRIQCRAIVEHGVPGVVAAGHGARTGQRRQKSMNTWLVRTAAVAVLLAAQASLHAQDKSADEESTAAIPATSLPYSRFASPQARAKFAQLLAETREGKGPNPADLADQRRFYQRYNDDRLREVERIYRSRVQSTRMGG